MAEQRFHVAIIGGGLCGLALAIALRKRSISYTIYEGRGSFTEIGAGINLGPNTIEAFNLIDPAISEKIYGLVTRNAPGKEEVWMDVRLGASTETFEDGEWVTQVMGPPTGNMTVSRNELLQLLASEIQIEHARFNKKLSSLEQVHDHVTLTFEDGMQDQASVVIGCDGAHSSVRRLVLGDDHPATKARFSGTGGYRAVFPMHLYVKAVGVDKARMSTVWAGPGSYMINYPIDGGKNVNFGLWHRKRGDWKHDEPWILPRQKQEMLEDFKAMGATVQNIMGMMDDQTAFWATFNHSVKPESYFDGRVCFIGDAAHSMSPHQGQGAAQAMEDACVMAEVLRDVNLSSSVHSMSEQIDAAFSSWEAVRKPRFEKVLDTSLEAFSWWADFWRPDLSERDMRAFGSSSEERLKWIWRSDIAGQGGRARTQMGKLLGSRRSTTTRQQAKLA